MAAKLNSMRLLDRAGIDYRIHLYEAESAPDATAVAVLVGVDPSRLFKTLVTLPDDGRRAVLAMLPSVAALDLKRLAAALQLKRLAMAPQRIAEQLTGLQVGGIGALALTDKRWPTVLDSSAADWPTILLSAGRRGTMLELAPDDVIRMTTAHYAAICLES